MSKIKEIKYIYQNTHIRSNEKCLIGTRLSIIDVISIAINEEREDYNLTQDQIDACFRELLEERKLFTNTFLDSQEEVYK